MALGMSSSPSSSRIASSSSVAPAAPRIVEAGRSGRALKPSGISSSVPQKRTPSVSSGNDPIGPVTSTSAFDPPGTAGLIHAPFTLASSADVARSAHPASACGAHRSALARCAEHPGIAHQAHAHGVEQPAPCLHCEGRRGERLFARASASPIRRPWAPRSTAGAPPVDTTVPRARCRAQLRATARFFAPASPASGPVPAPSKPRQPLRR